MKNKGIFVLNKKEGETPLQALESFRAKNKIREDVKMTYAGRLDPLVGGLFVILAGDAIKEKEKYLGLSKEYVFEVLFGFATDTYDILGKVVEEITRQNLTIISEKELEIKIREGLNFFTGSFEQEYPLYSSKTIKSARRGKKVKAPRHVVFVKSIKFLKFKKISSENLLKNIERRVGKVKGDFRQKEILKIWRKNLNVKHRMFDIACFKVKCGSGTYVRSIANDLGEKIGISALAFSIKRTKIGKWSKIQI